MAVPAFAAGMLAGCSGDEDRDWGPLAVVPGDDTSSAAANLSGLLKIGADCVTVVVGDEKIEYTIIWRAGRTQWDPQRRVIRVETESGDQVEFSDGQSVELGGGSFGEPTEWVSAPKASCPTRRFSAQSFE